MLYNIFKLARRQTHKVQQTVSDEGRDDCDNWRRDPMSHPDIRRMSARERDDLPVDPRQIANE